MCPAFAGQSLESRLAAQRSVERLLRHGSGMSEFTLYAVDHDELEIWILRVLRAIGEKNRAEWTAVVRELRKHKLTDPFEDEPLSGRSIAMWGDARLSAALLALTMIRARHRFDGGMGRMYQWLSELPERISATPAEQGEFHVLRSAILDRQRPFPKHLAFLADPDAKCSYVLPDEVYQMARAMAEGGYLARAAQVLAADRGEPHCGRFLERLLGFVMSTSRDGHALYFHEHHT